MSCSWSKTCDSPESSTEPIFVGSVEVNTVFEFQSFAHSVSDCEFES